MATLAYSIGYSDLIDASHSNLALASLINRYGSVVSANGNSVTYAVMELGGSLDVHFNALLEDGASSNAWPLTGYTYFIIRTQTHLGSCEQRTAAMNFLYNFYYSDAVTEIALRLGYATLPAFIRNIVAGKLVSSAQCNTGEYALSKYVTNSINIMTTLSISAPLSTYLSAYYTIDSSTSWNALSFDNSDFVWRGYISAPMNAVAALTMFLSPTTKRSKYLNSGYNLLTTPFAHIAVVPLYHLNAFTSKANGPLRVTADILAKIYTGKILYWNDSLLQQANMENRKYLPFQRIVIVARPNSSDVNQIFTRYLGSVSIDFQTIYDVPSMGDGIRSINFDGVLSPGSWLAASDNVHVDAYVTFYDGSIGYYLQADPPVSSVAYFCHDPSCHIIVAPTLGSSLSACETDPSTFVQLNSMSSSYDLMSSNSSNCYPIVGTVDYTILTQNGMPSCSLGSTGVAHQSVKFGAWIFNGSAMVQPLSSLSMAGTSSSLRYTAQQRMCKIECSNSYLGYDYCSYRKCSWDDGDYFQVVSSCNPKYEKRKVQYVVPSDNLCIQNTDLSPSTPQYIACDYVDMESVTGISCIAICLFGIIFSLGLLSIALYSRNERKFRRSQPIYVFVFLFGAIIMNCTAFVYLGENTDLTCILRPWLYNIALSIMYGPLIMKLYAVDKMFFSTKIKKVVSSETRVLLEVAAMLIADLIILTIWSAIETPVLTYDRHTYPGCLDSITDATCSSGAVSEYVMVAYKCVMLGMGMFKAVTTWHVTSDISEAKQYSVALAVGGIAYLMSIFVGFNVNTTVLMRCVGIFLSGTMSVALIMIPKFMKRKGPSHSVHPSQANRKGSFMSSMLSSRFGFLSNASNHSNASDDGNNGSLPKTNSQIVDQSQDKSMSLSTRVSNHFFRQGSDHAKLTRQNSKNGQSFRQSSSHANKEQSYRQSSAHGNSVRQNSGQGNLFRQNSGLRSSVTKSKYAVQPTADEEKISSARHGNKKTGKVFAPEPNHEIEPGMRSTTPVMRMDSTEEKD